MDTSSRSVSAVAMGYKAPCSRSFGSWEWCSLGGFGRIEIWRLVLNYVVLLLLDIIGSWNCPNLVRCCVARFIFQDAPQDVGYGLQGVAAPPVRFILVRLQRFNDFVEIL